jgi:hypothetical protein
MYPASVSASSPTRQGLTATGTWIRDPARALAVVQIVAIFVLGAVTVARFHIFAAVDEPASCSAGARVHISRSSRPPSDVDSPCSKLIVRQDALAALDDIQIPELCRDQRSESRNSNSLRVNEIVSLRFTTSGRCPSARRRSRRTRSPSESRGCCVSCSAIDPNITDPPASPLSVDPLAAISRLGTYLSCRARSRGKSERPSSRDRRAQGSRQGRIERCSRPGLARSATIAPRVLAGAFGLGCERAPPAESPAAGGAL